MDIMPEEVESVKTIGNLHGSDVKMVKTRGGLFVAIGKKEKSKNKLEALAAGSHGAIVSHHVTKQFGSDFRPAIFKSEQDSLGTVKDNTEFLPSTAISKGMELYTISKGSTVDFVLSKYGLSVLQYSAEIEDGSLVVKKSSSSIDKDSDIAKAVSKTIVRKAEELGVSKIKKI